MNQPLLQVKLSILQIILTMKSRFATLTAFIAIALFVAPLFGSGLPVSITRPAGYVSLHEDPPAPFLENECPPVTNIKVEMLQGGKVLITWDLVPGDPKYAVKLEDENQNVLLDSTVQVNKVMVSGLIPGVKYKFMVCYICKKTGKPVCAYKGFKYIIIEDQVVMFDGNNACSCQNTAGTEGACNSSQSPYFSLESGRVYNIHLTDNSTITFACNNTVNPVGNCPTNFDGLGYGLHGDNAFDLPFYQVGTSRVFFHGSTFCVQGEDVDMVTFCNLSIDKEQEKDLSPVEKVYPNPFSDRIVVEPGAGETTIEVFNATGQLVLEKTAQISGQLVLNTETFAPGLYWLCIRGEGRENSVHRLLKAE